MTPQEFVDVLVERTEFTDSCWNWKGSFVRGYGQWPRLIKGTRYKAHQVSYIFFKGPRYGLTVDHTCENPKCVNPDHLELCTRAENARRYWDRDDKHCVNGHLIEGSNAGRRKGRTYPRCRICAREATRRYRQRRGE